MGKRRTDTSAGPIPGRHGNEPVMGGRSKPTVTPGEGAGTGHARGARASRTGSSQTVLSGVVQPREQKQAAPGLGLNRFPDVFGRERPVASLDVNEAGKPWRDLRNTRTGTTIGPG